MKKRILALTIAALSVIGIAEARFTTYWVFGSGTAQDEDRQSAISQAYDQATESANATCIGSVVEVERTGTSCLGGGDSPFTCVVFVKAACQVHTR